MKTKYALTFILVVGSISSTAAAARRRWIAPDFFVDAGSAQHAFVAKPKRPTDCRTQLARSVCVVDRSRSCKSDDQVYVDFFEGVYDALPPAMQQMFCSVNTIYVEKELESIAYAGMTYNGPVIGMRQSVIDEQLDLSTLISWKEQLPFGGERKGYHIRKDLPAVEVRGELQGAQLLAYYILAHEFAHLFDFGNNVNQFADCPSDGQAGDDCEAQRKSWTALSWATGETPLTAFEYPYRERVCYYNCSSGKVPVKAIKEMYEGFAKTGFATVYASTNPYDDFAESVAFYLLAGQKGASYTLDSRFNKYDMLKRLEAPAFAAKRAYVEAFLARSNLRYP